MENVSSNISPIALLAKKIDQQIIPRGFDWAEATNNYDLDKTSDIIVGISDSVKRERFISYIFNLYKLYKFNSVSTTYTSTGYVDTNKWHEDLRMLVNLKLEVKKDEDYYSQNEAFTEGESMEEEVEENLRIRQLEDKIAELEQGIYTENGEKKKTVASHSLDVILVLTNTKPEDLRKSKNASKRKAIIKLASSLSGATEGTIEKYLKPSHHRKDATQSQVADLNIARSFVEGVKIQ